MRIHFLPENIYRNYLELVKLDFQDGCAFLCRNEYCEDGEAACETCRAAAVDATQTHSFRANSRALNHAFSHLRI